jgi:hypothetical protein
MTETYLEYQFIATLLSTVPNSDNLQAFLKTLVDASYHVGEKRACQSMQASMHLLVIRA